MTMASHLRRGRSNRRIAAISFLSNISLDGSRTKPANNNKNLPNSDYLSDKQEEENVQCNQGNSRKQLINNEAHSLSSDSDSVVFVTTTTTTTAPLAKSGDADDRLAKREKTPCENIPDKKRLETVRKRMMTMHQQHSVMTIGDVDNKQTYAGSSSSESVVTSLTVQSSRHQHLRASPSQLMSTTTGFSYQDGDGKRRTVTFVKSVKSHRFNNERLIMIAGAPDRRRTPFHVCSFIPYTKSHRTRPDLKRDAASRKRTVSSGQRPLSALGGGSDGSDPFEAFGMIRDGHEEVSYGKLLMPTKASNLSSSVREQRHQQQRNVGRNDDGNVETNRHGKVPVARCVSYDQPVPPPPPLPPPPLPQSHSAATSLSSSYPLALLPCAHQQQPNYGSLAAMDAGKEDRFYSGAAVGNVVYHPHLLDDPELMAGKHRTLLTFTSYVTSVIDYVRPSDLKREINDKFRTRFPHLQLTLSKLRSLKREMKKIARMESATSHAALSTVANSASVVGPIANATALLPLGGVAASTVVATGDTLLTVAQAYVYFEKLILRGLVDKRNRKLCAGASLMLSAKLNDVKGDALRSLIERIESVFRLNRRDLVTAEFAVLIALEFGLHVPNWQIYAHYQRLLYDS